MDPRIHYVRTSDDVSIGYWALGQGVPLIVPPILVSSHIEMEWQIPSRRASFEALANGARVIRYDCRGIGMSQRDAIDFSMEAAFRDLEAVADGMGLEQFALLRIPTSNDVAIAYAAAHPERVSHLVIWEGHNQDERLPERAKELEAIDPVIDRNWELYTKIRARLISGWDTGNAPMVEEMLRATHTPESLKAVNAVVAATDPLPYLGDVKVPTLVLYRVGMPAREVNARLFASRIRGAHLAGIRETAIGTYPNAAGVKEILEFLNPEAVQLAREATDEGHHGDLRVILFSDLEKHTAMMQRLGDERGRQVLREHEALTREALAAYGGSEVKTMGDSFMASFGSATRALECAIALQRAFEARNETASEPLHIHVGLSAGEPIAEDDDLFGSSVILAARIADQAKGGEIVLANVVRELAAGKGFLFADRGEVVLRGFEDPVHLYELRWRE
ncbi:MAG: adenylate/guanylate cyclase domain-containing protein [Dehalococcoidia bacterium]